MKKMKINKKNLISWNKWLEEVLVEMTRKKNEARERRRTEIREEEKLVLKGYLAKMNKDGLIQFCKEFKITEKELEKSIGKDYLKEISGIFANLYFDSPLKGVKTRMGYKWNGKKMEEEWFEPSGKRDDKTKKIIFKILLDKYAEYFSKITFRKFGLGDLGVYRDSKNSNGQELYQEYQHNALKYGIDKKDLKGALSYIRKMIKNKAKEMYFNALNLSEGERKTFREAKTLDRQGKYQEADDMYKQIHEKPLSLERENKIDRGRNEEEVSLSETIADKSDPDLVNAKIDLKIAEKSLSKEDRKVYDLWKQELPSKEIAKRTGKTEGAVEVQISRIKEKLRKRLMM